MDKKERFNKAFSFLKYENVIRTQDDVARKMGASRSNISSALNGKESALTDNFLMRFCTAFKQISLDWLITGKGDMLTVAPNFKSENTPQVLESIVDKDIQEEQVKMTDRIMELIRGSQHTPKTFALEADIELSLFLKKLAGKAVWSVADVHKICDTYKVRKGWLVDGGGQKFRLPDKVLETIPARRSYDLRVGVPYYNVDFEMGFDLLENDQTTKPSYMIDFAPYNKCDAWCNARGNSMYPTIASGDIVALKIISDPRVLISGEVYGLITVNQLRTIKRVKDLGNQLLLIPDNKEFPEQTIDKKDILKVYQVVGSMKMF